MSLLVGSKVMNVCVPFLFKGAVDSLGVLNMNSAPETVLALSSSLLIGCELKSSLFHFESICYNSISFLQMASPEQEPLVSMSYETLSLPE